MSNLTISNLKSKVNTISADLDGLETQVSNLETNFNNHSSTTSAAHPASSITLAPIGNFAATDLQSAVDELLSKVQDHLDSFSAHTANSIVTDDLSTLVGSDVQDLLGQLEQLTINNHNIVMTRIDNLEAECIAIDAPVGRSFVNTQQAIDVLNTDIVALQDDVSDHETDIQMILTTLLNSGIDQTVLTNLRNGILGFTGLILPTNPPTNPQAGSAYVDTANNRLYIYNGTAWKYTSLI